MSGSAWAGAIVDLSKGQESPLGEVLENKSGDQAYFSLGNGRAIKFSLAKTSDKDKKMLKKLILNRMGGSSKAALMKKRNLKW